jgi:hypothetical protein
VRQIKAPPTLRTFSQFPRGPQRYKYSVDEDVRGGPGEPPLGFLVATNSVTEWMVYWGMFPALNIGMDARKSGPPFIGVPGFFTYQTPMLGGRSLPGGAVPDFVIERTRTGIPVIIRVVTEFWHIFTTNAKQTADMLQKQRIDDEADVVDVYDYTFTGDPTGQAVIQVIKSAAGLIELPDPMRSGVARRNAR